MSDGPTIVIVEDDGDIRTQLAAYLEEEGFRVVGLDGAPASTGTSPTGPLPDLIVLDWMLPGEDGLSICRRLRAADGPPIVMLTAKDEDIDRVLGLEMGADDYVSKPFNPRVLLARIRAVLRRANGRGAATVEADPETLMVADLTIDLAARRVTIGEAADEIALTSAEYDLLHCFVTRPQRVLSRDQLLDWTRGRTADAFDRTIDVQISRLRHKLDASGSAVSALLKTVRNAGYILAAPVRRGSVMARVGLLGRIMLLLLGALSLLVLATVAVDTWQRRQERSPYGTRFPRVDQAANIVILLRDADPALRPAILKAVSGEALRAEITDGPPDDRDLIPEPRLERRLRRMTGDPNGPLRAFTGTAMLHRGVDPDEAKDRDRNGPIGRLATATYRLPDGRTLVISAVEKHRSLMPWLLGLPLSLWVAVLGAVVAGLVLVGARHELAPLRRLTDAVTRFDGHAHQPVATPRGAPEIRRLSRAVRDMQERIVGLLGERSLLIGAISHDLKTYLTRLRLRAEGVSEPERRDRLVEDLDAMTALIETSLGFARGTALEVGRTAVDLADLVAVEVAEYAAQGLDVRLTGEDVPDAIAAGDAVALRRVVANLIGNAVKFGRSTVAVTVSRSGALCRVTVEDDGPGIPELKRSAVFSPFYRIEHSRNRRTGGTGLGLAIARQIAEAHGGTVVAEASPLGGARLVATLPAIA